MENSNTEIICIIDKSGSMEALKNETITGLNNFIKSQQNEESACTFSLVQFNQEISTTIKREPINKIGVLKAKDYNPYGYTALYDALGITLKSAIEAIYTLPAETKPNKVMVFIITDGLENASRYYTKIVIQKLIEKLVQNNQWEFEFFGANINSFAEAENIGLKREKANNWEYSKSGIDKMVESMSEKAIALRKMNS